MITKKGTNSTIVHHYSLFYRLSLLQKPDWSDYIISVQKLKYSLVSFCYWFCFVFPHFIRDISMKSCSPGDFSVSLTLPVKIEPITYGKINGIKYKLLE